MWKCIGIYTAISHHIYKSPSAGAFMLTEQMPERRMRIYIAAKYRAQRHIFCMRSLNLPLS